MIGVYDYTVVLTYISLISSLIGIFAASTGHSHLSIFCLAISGLLDGFDGKVARTKKNRTAEEKRFGIQIDSLCDMICFGVLPVMICYHSGMRKWYSMAILVFYCLAGLIRLAYFNVLEETRQQQTTENRKYYLGMPITSIAIILPLLYLCSAFLQTVFIPVLHSAMLLTGFLFILRFKFKKPNNKEFYIMIALIGIVVVFILYNYKRRGIFTWNWRSLTETLLQIVD